MRTHTLVLLALVAVIVQSCCCCTILGGPQPPYSITPPTETAEDIRERWSEMLDGSPDGTFRITITEAEMTSLVTKALDQKDDLPPIEDVQVHFRNGRIEAYATVTIGDSLPVPGMIAFSASVTDGEIDVTLEEIAFGPMPIPESALEATTDMVDELISDSMRDELDRATITDIQIGEGEMTISGQITP